MLSQNTLIIYYFICKKYIFFFIMLSPKQKLERPMGTVAAPPRPPIGTLSSSYSSLRFGGKIGVSVRVNARSSASSSATGEEFLPNARRRKIDPTWCGGGFSLGVDLGASRTGLALGKGYSPRPLIVTIQETLISFLFLRIRFRVNLVSD